MAPSKPSGYTEKNYSWVAPLGAGGQGRVYIMRQKHGSKKLVAVKQCRADHPQMEAEVHVVRNHLNTKSYNIPAILDFYKEPDGPITIVTPFYDAGSLDSLISAYRDNKKRMPEAFVWHAAACLFDALAHAHRHHIVHRDIKPANVFVRWQAGADRRAAYPVLALGDWGLGVDTRSPAYRPHQKIGTFVWQPPELPAGTPPADVWALGAVLHAMCTYNPPIRELPRQYCADVHKILAWWKTGSTRQVTDIRALGYSDELYRTLKDMLDFDPEVRATAQSLARLLPKRADHYDRHMFEPLIRSARRDVLDMILPEETALGHTTWKTAEQHTTWRAARSPEPRIVEIRPGHGGTKTEMREPEPRDPFCTEVAGYGDGLDDYTDLLSEVERIDEVYRKKGDKQASREKPDAIPTFDIRDYETRLDSPRFGSQGAVKRQLQRYAMRRKRFQNRDYKVNVDDSDDLERLFGDLGINRISDPQDFYDVLSYM